VGTALGVVEARQRVGPVAGGLPGGQVHHDTGSSEEAHRVLPAAARQGVRAGVAVHGVVPRAPIDRVAPRPSAEHVVLQVGPGDVVASRAGQEELHVVPDVVPLARLPVAPGRADLDRQVRRAEIVGPEVEPASPDERVAAVGRGPLIEGVVVSAAVLDVRAAAAVEAVVPVVSVEGVLSPVPEQVVPSRSPVEVVAVVPAGQPIHAALALEGVSPRPSEDLVGPGASGEVVGAVLPPKDHLRAEGSADQRGPGHRVDPSAGQHLELLDAGGRHVDVDGRRLQRVEVDPHRGEREGVRPPGPHDGQPIGELAGEVDLELDLRGRPLPGRGGARLERATRQVDGERGRSVRGVGGRDRVHRVDLRRSSAVQEGGARPDLDLRAGPDHRGGVLRAPEDDRERRPRERAGDRGPGRSGQPEQDETQQAREDPRTGQPEAGREGERHAGIRSNGRRASRVPAAGKTVKTLISVPITSGDRWGLPHAR
jgi:hypothetical protein